MTDIQLKELQILEIKYIDAVKGGSPHEQTLMIELLLYWIKKQLNDQRAKVVVITGGVKLRTPTEITQKQMEEFAILQSELVKCLFADDRQRLIEWELTMREWVDSQLTATLNEAFRPELKIIRNYKK